GAIIPRENTPWPRGERARRGGVSSFGFGGTNVHVVVEEAPPPIRGEEGACAGPWLLALSARSETSLRWLGARIAAQVQTSDESELANVCMLASATRAEFPCRLSLLVRSREEAVAELGAFGRGAAVARARSGTARRPARLAFLFSGQGAQYPGM